MKFICTMIAICALLVVGCGPDPDLVASGKIHSCKLAEATVQLQADPTNAALQKEVNDRASFLQTVVETADEGSRAALQEAITAAVAEGCN